MDQAWPAIVALITTLGTIGGGYFLTRRYRKLGVGPAEAALTSAQTGALEAQRMRIDSLEGLLGTEREERERDKVQFGRQLDTAQATILELTAQFKKCQGRLHDVEKYIADNLVKPSHDPG